MQNQPLHNVENVHKWSEVLKDLIGGIEHYTADNSLHADLETQIPGLTFFRHNEPTSSRHRNLCSQHLSGCTRRKKGDIR